MSTTSLALPKTKYELEFNQGSVYSEEERDAVLRVLANNAPSCGAEVLEFEREFSSFIGSNHAIAVGNATQGLEIAVRAAVASFTARSSSTPSSSTTSPCEVIVPSISWISTASAAALAGATVRFADVKDPTLCVDIDSIKSLVNANTCAVIVVHLFGRAVEGVHALSQWLRERNIILIEDCAHAIDASDRDSGLRCGNIGDIGIFSFHQQKNMVTLGEGGMVVTSNSRLRELMVGYRSLCAMSFDPKGKYLAIDSNKHPMGNKYWLIDFFDHGSNYRMIDMQAAVGRVQLKKVKEWNARRGQIARALHRGLSSVHKGLRVADVDTLRKDTGEDTCAWHIFHIFIDDSFPLGKEQFMWSLLQDYGIKTWNHYSPMHLAKSFRSKGLGRRGDCPVAESLFEQYVSLPIHPRLTDEAVSYMIDAIKEISTRTFVPRMSPTPLLDALLELSDPNPNPNSNSNSHSDSDQPHGSIVSTSHNKNNSNAMSDQLNLFKGQVHEAISTGFFNASNILLTRAPGRLDLMGGNDDYTGGLVFECTIAEGTFVAVQKSPMNNNVEPPMVVIRNKQLSEQDICIPVSALRESSLTPGKLAAYLLSTFPSSRWQLYVVGGLYWIHTKFPSEMFDNGSSGLSILLWSNVPLNRGVSSSASVEVAVMKAAAAAFQINLEGETLATACQWVENQVCSSACGLMDQMAVTLGGPFMAMRCQPAIVLTAPPLPQDLTVYALDSGVSHEVSGIEYEAARAAAFMGYKIICDMEGLEVYEQTDSEIPRFTDKKYNGYLANMSPSTFHRLYEEVLPIAMSGQDFLDRFGKHVDPATPVLPDHVYNIRANTKYAVYENNRVNLFFQLIKGCPLQGGDHDNTELYEQLGELMYQSHDSYTECGLGSTATSLIVDLVRNLGPSKQSGLFGAKITGGGAGGTVAILGLASAREVFQKHVVEPYAQLRGLAEPPYVFAGSSLSADAFGVQVYN